MRTLSSHEAALLLVGSVSVCMCVYEGRGRMEAFGLLGLTLLTRNLSFEQEWDNQGPSIRVLLLLG